MQMLDYARERNVPVWTELSWLQFLEAKDGSTFQNITWANNELTFDIHSNISFDRELACLVPYRFNDKKVNAVRVGERTTFDVIAIKGTEYARLYFKTGVGTHFEVFYGE